MELRIRETGTIITESEFRSIHKNTSFPSTLTPEILDSFGVDPILAGIAFSMGTANNPSAYFEGYTNTGWFSPTGGQFSVVSVGNTILNVNPNGIVVTGIASATGFAGTFSGTSAVFSGNSTGNIVRITQTGSGNALIVEDETNPDVSSFVITGIGSVGIQTNAPSANLDVFGGMKISRQDAAFDGGEITFARASDNVNAWSLDVYGSNANTSFRITDVINSQPRIQISPGGNVGFGSTATSRLHVFGDAIVTGVVTASAFVDDGTNLLTEINTKTSTGKAIAMAMIFG